MQKGKKEKGKITKSYTVFFSHTSYIILHTAVILLFIALNSSSAFAQAGNLNPPPSSVRTLNTPTTDPNLDPNSSGFKIVVCDGPTLPANYPNKPANYVPCDFNGVMLQVQHLINIAMVLGVLVAIVMFSYAGGLYITGKKANVDKAHSIFPKVFFGFIIMLSAWFIVYQILSWLTNNDGFKALLGNP